MNNKQQTQLEEETIKFNQQRAKFNDFLRDLYSQNINQLNSVQVQKIYNEFCNFVLNENPYVMGDNKKIPVYVGRIEDKNTQGQTNRAYGHIVISNEFLFKALITKEIPLVEAFYVLGHERRHVSQINAVDGINEHRKQYTFLNDQDKQKINNLSRDLSADKIKKESVPFVLGILQDQLGDVFQDFSSMPKEKQEQLCEKFVNDQYFKFEHEIDARETGYEFAEFMLEALNNDPNLDGYIKKDLMQQKKHLQDLKTKDKLMLEKQNMVRKAVGSAIDKQDFRSIIYNSKEIEDKIASLMPTYEAYNNDRTKALKDIDNIKSNQRAALINAVEYITNEKSKNFSVDELIDYACISSASGYNIGLNTISRRLKSKPDFTQNKQKDLTKRIHKMLTESKELPMDTYRQNYLQLVGSEGVESIITRLLDSGKLAFATTMFDALAKDVKLARINKEISEKDEELLQNLENKMLNKIKQFAQQENKKDSISFEEVYLVSSNITETLYDPHYSDKKRSSKQLKIEEKRSDVQANMDELKNKNRMSQQEEKEYLTSKYGKTIAEEGFWGGRDSFRIAMEYENEAKKHKNNKKIDEDKLLSAGGL